MTPQTPTPGTLPPVPNQITTQYMQYQACATMNTGKEFGNEAMKSAYDGKDAGLLPVYKTNQRLLTRRIFFAHAPRITSFKKFSRGISESFFTASGSRVRSLTCFSLVACSCVERSPSFLYI